MKQSDQTILLVVIGLLMFSFKSAGSSFTNVLQDFLPSVEGFLPTPVWDVRQWTWGYGTAAGYDPNNKPAGSISREKAWADALAVINSHYSYLSRLITVNMKPQQWAALLSFSYNLGTGNADNLVANINKQDTAALITEWKKYIIADHKVNQGLINRRNKEVALWLS